MTFTQALLIGVVISSMQKGLQDMIAKGRMPEKNIETAKARILELVSWLEAQHEAYFPEQATTDAAACELFEARVARDFMAR